MRLGSEMHDGIGAILSEDPIKGTGVAYIDLSEAIVRSPRDRCDRLQICGIGEFVDVQDVPTSITHEIPDERGPNEAGSACDDDPHRLSPKARI
jgi:hypothetical protein